MAVELLPHTGSVCCVFCKQLHLLAGSMRHLGCDCQAAGCAWSPQAVKCIIPTRVTVSAERGHQNILPWWGQGQRALCLTGGFNGEGLMKLQGSDSETAVQGSHCVGMDGGRCKLCLEKSELSIYAMSYWSICLVHSGFPTVDVL